MFRLLLLTFFLVGCTKPILAPQEWTKWVESRKASFQKKISTPAAVQFLYVPETKPEFYLNKSERGYRLSKGKLNPSDTAYKLNFQDESLLDSSNTKIADSSSHHKVNEHIYLRTAFYKSDKKVRIFLYDLNKKDLAQKRNRTFYPYSKNQKLTSVYTKFESVKKTKFQRSDGTTRDFSILGSLKTKNGSTFSVYAESDQTEKAVMLMFRDTTNGESTYGAGRYLYIDLPKAPSQMQNGDQVGLDFNFTFNPPCAVSKGYHCPLPQDFANFKIEAGEQYAN